MSGAGAYLSQQLAGRVAIVTGGASGIGKGICRVLAARGALVAVVDLDGEAAGVTAEEISAGGSRPDTRHFQADVTDRASLDEVVERLIGSYGHIDICVANAGVIGGPGFTERRDYTDDDWDATQSVNLRGVVNTNDAVKAHMIERGAGRIINIASHSGRAPRGGPGTLGDIQIPYSVSKAGVIQWTMHLALHLGQHGITANAVCPGTLWTPMWERIANMRRRHDESVRDLSPKEIFDRQIALNVPLGRPQTPEDIGNAVAFLASDDARVITGQALNVNGGAMMN